MTLFRKSHKLILASAAFLFKKSLLIAPTATAFSTRSMSSKTHTTLRDGSGTITVAPKKETDQSGLVVICHGLGDSSEGFADVAEHLASQMPHLKFILPTAPTQPVTMNMGMPMPSWYDITGLDERSNENCKGIAESRDRITSILHKEHQSTNLPYNRMVLAGFSQGGALSLFSGMQMPADEKLAGIVVMSGYLPAAAQFKITDGVEDTPILHCHGENDPMVVVGMAQRSQQMVTASGAKSYELKTYPGLVHSVNMEEVAYVQNFLEKIVPVSDDCKVKLKDPSEMSVKELREAIRKAGLGQKAVGLMEKSEFVKLVQNHRDGKL